MMRQAVIGVTMVLAVTACATPGPQRMANSTPTAEMLKWQRQQARVDPVDAGAVIAAGLALQLSGAVKDGQIVVPGGHPRHKRVVDHARTDASAVPLTSRLPATSGKPGLTPVDPATGAAAGYEPPPAVPFVVKLPPGMD